METAWNEWLAQAREAAHAAGVLIRQHLGRPAEVSYKSLNNPVTDVDLACQALIRKWLLDRNPEHGFLGEEGNDTGLDQDYLWIVDPIDGTINFAHGYPFVSVSIALEHRGQVILGVVYDPTREETFEALWGGGARLNGRTLEVSERDQLGTALLVTGFAGDSELGHELFLAFCHQAQSLRKDGSAALDLCYVAAGRSDGFYELGLNPWDVAAGALILTEAQGMITDCGGRPYDIRGRQVVASNVRLHKQMLDVFQSRLERIDQRCPPHSR